MAIALVFTIIIGFCASGFFYVLAKLKASQNESSQLREEKQKLEGINNIFQQKNLDLEKQNDFLKQEQNHLEKQRQEWTKDKETMLFQLANDLMKKNQEQQNQLSVQQQESVKKITENLFKSFENVTAKMVSLTDDVKKTSELTNLTRQALLSPGAAGRTAEITLENILKNSGLREKADLNSVGDYVLQSHFSGVNNSSEQESKRPDAIIFFPNDQLSIIDSKSSPHFLDLEIARQNEDFEQEKIILGKIKESFRKHLESLKRKDYAKFLFEEMRNKNANDYRVMIIMFLQTEKMMEVIRETDSNFEQKALESGVVVASPIGLINFLSQARVVIDRSKQEKNIEDLKIEVRKLLDNVAVIFKESQELGKSLNKALTMHNKMTKTLNRGVHAAVRNISDLGITGKKSAEIKILEEYELKDDGDELENL